ncbi:hypothetical protein TRVL_08226 [Trypanosoma vivax]|nr:hypothetical protein TRVL_08226 [Trypanosoma vivax]
MFDGPSSVTKFLVCVLVPSRTVKLVAYFHFAFAKRPGNDEPVIATPAVAGFVRTRTFSSPCPARPVASATVQHVRGFIVECTHHIRLIERFGFRRLVLLGDCAEGRFLDCLQKQKETTAHSTNFVTEWSSLMTGR